MSGQAVCEERSVSPDAELAVEIPRERRAAPVQQGNGGGLEKLTALKAAVLNGADVLIVVAGWWLLRRLISRPHTAPLNKGVEQPGLTPWHWVGLETKKATLKKMQGATGEGGGDRGILQPWLTIKRESHFNPLTAAFRWCSFRAAKPSSLILKCGHL